MHPSSLRLGVIALDAALHLLLPVRAEPHNAILTESDDEKRNDLACKTNFSAAWAKVVNGTERTDPETLKAEMCFRLEGKGDAEREGEYVVCYEVEEGPKMLSSYHRGGSSCQKSTQ